MGVVAKLLAACTALAFAFPAWADEATGSMTRPNNATPYASGQLVANNTAAGSVVPVALNVAAQSKTVLLDLRRVRLAKSGTTVTNATFRVHFYEAAPVPSNGDGGNWLTSNAARYVGSFDVTVDKVFTDGAKGNGVPTVGTNSYATIAQGGSLYALLEARGAYTPATSEVFSITVEFERK